MENNLILEGLLSMVTELKERQAFLKFVLIGMKNSHILC